MPAKPKIYDTLLFIALLSGPPKLRVRDPLESLDNVVDWAVLLNLGVWVCGAAWVLARIVDVFVFEKRMPAFNVSTVFGAMFVGTLFLSLITSAAPLLTLYRSLQVAVALFFCFYWVADFGVDSALRNLFWGLVFCALMILLLAAMDPDAVFAYNRLMGGVWGSAGSVAALGCMLGVCYPLTWAWLRWSLIFVFATILALSMTRSAYAAVLVPLALAFLRGSGARDARRMVWVAFFLLPIAAVFEWAPQWETAVLRDTESLATLSDRLPLWSYLLDEWWDRSPWFGLGFFAIRDIALAYNPGIGTAHSGYVEVLAGAGILGFAAYGVVVIYQLNMVRRVLSGGLVGPEIFAAASLFLGVLLLGVTSEDSIIASPVSFTFWLTVAMLPTLARQKSAQALR